MSKYKTLIDVIEDVSSFSDKGITFIYGKDNEIYLPYAELYSKAKKVLYNLQEKGMKPGDEVVFQISDIQKFIITFWACILGQFIVVPVTIGKNEEALARVFNIWNILNKPRMITDLDENFLLRESKVSNEKLRNDMKNNTILIDDIFVLDKDGEVFKSLPSTISYVQFSSGSTGAPKGVTLTHENLVTNIYDMANQGKGEEKDVFLSWVPVTHDMGMILCHMLPMLKNMQQYLMPTEVFIKSPLTWMDKVSEHKVTIIISPNFGYKYFLSMCKADVDYGWDLSNIKHVINGAEPISPQLCNAFLDFLERYKLSRKAFLNVYGLAEATVGAAIPKEKEYIVPIYIDRNHIGVGEKVRYLENADSSKAIPFVQVGYPLKACKFKFCDNDKNELPEDTIGNIYIKGKNVISGYYNDIEATNKVIDEEGWLDTGDLGFIKDGKVVITGRSKDVVIVDGQNYYTFDIERIIHEIEEVRTKEVAVCSVKESNSNNNEVINAYIKTSDNIEEFLPLVSKVKSYVSSQIGLNIKYVIPINELPKTFSGKVQRNKLNSWFEEGKFDEIINKISKLQKTNEKSKINDEVSISEVEKKLLKIWRDVLQDDKMGINDNFFLSGGNSVLLIKMASMIEEEYPNKITIADMFNFTTIHEIAKYIEDSGDNICLSSITLPNGYFIGSESNNSNNVFEAIINGNLLKKLEDLAKEEEVNVNNLLLAMYYLAINKVLQLNMVSVESMIEDINEVISKSVNFSNIEGFSDLLNDISHSKSYKRYNLCDLNKVFKNNKENQITMFFYDNNMMKVNEDIKNIYDLMIEVNKNNEELNISMKYNYKKLNKEKVKDLFEKYLNIIKLIISSC